MVRIASSNRHALQGTVTVDEVVFQSTGSMRNDHGEQSVRGVDMKIDGNVPNRFTNYEHCRKRRNAEQIDAIAGSCSEDIAADGNGDDSGE